jgi:methylmalonyl-CoA mutase
VKTALDGVALDAVSTYWQCGPSSVPVAALVIAAAEQLGVSPARLRGGFENDPLAELVAKGALRQSLQLRFDHMAALTAYAAKHAPQLRTITVKGDVYHNAGATATQELAYVIATLVCYIEEMKSRGLAPETVLPHVRIRLSVGSDYFMEISKIRAARWLWSKVAAAYGVENAPVHIHASTSRGTRPPTTRTPTCCASPPRPSPPSSQARTASTSAPTTKSPATPTSSRAASPATSTPSSARNAASTA